MALTTARVPMMAVNMEVMMPSDSVTAKPRIGPVPKVNSTMAAISVVMLPSAMADRAFSYPEWIAACGVLPFLISSRMRSKISTFASTAMPTVSTMPAIPGSVSAACSMDMSATRSTTLASSAQAAMMPNTR
jgi:hypothetical protein